MPKPNDHPGTLRLPVDEIILPVDHPRRVAVEGAAERLAASLEDVGLLMPIAVTSEFVLIFGSRRLAAAKLLGWTHIEARVFESAEDPQLRRLMAWEENDARQSLSLEEQLAFKREVLDPMLESRARSSRREETAGSVPRVTCDRSGSAREIIGNYLQISARTLEKFEKIARWSEDETLAEPIRDEAVRARERANTLGKVDGEYKRVRNLVESQTAASRDESVEVEHQLTRVFNSLDKLIDEHPARAVGADLSTGVWRGIATALQHVLEWGRDVKAVRDDRTP